MSDIVSDLREHANYDKHSIYAAEIMYTAADEIERLRELCESAEHWLTLPPTTGSDRYCVEELCRKLKAAGQGGKP
jgi:hypothetical protein